MFRCGRNRGKRRFFASIVLSSAFLSIIVAQSAQLSLAPQSIAPANSVIVPVQFSTSGAAVSSIQFDLSFPSPALLLSATPGPGLSSTLKSFYSVLVSNSQQRFLVVGSDAAPIPDGTLLNVIVDAGPGIALGKYSLKFSNVIASGPDGSGVVVSGADGLITVQAGDPAVLTPNLVLNGAGLQQGGVAPGEIVTLFGAGFRPSSTGALSDTSVLVNNVPAPLLYAGTVQINAIVPYAVAGQSSARISVSYRNKKMGEATVPVVTVAPGVFTLNGTGVGQGAVLNQDLTVNSALLPAAPGSSVSIYATGAGVLDPALRDGEIAPNSQSVPISKVSVKIGGMDAPVSYAGSAPGLVNGVLQVNCTVPATLNPGPAIPVVVQVGTAFSQPGVTIAIR